MRARELVPADFAAVNSAAKILATRYRGLVEYDDLVQEGFAWLLGNYAQVEAWRGELSEVHSERTIVKAVRQAVERYCRKEKAAKEGYQVEDEYFYSIPQTAELLRMYLDPEWMMPTGQQLDERTSGGRPASEGGNLVTMVYDVGRAFEAMPTHDRTLLYSIYGPGHIPADSIAVYALEWDITYSAADSRIRRVVGRLRAALGGPSPWGKK